MEEFQNVTVVKKANIYFDGKVTSRTVLFDSKRMEILAGTVRVLLPGRTEWQTIEAGQSFQVPANSKFQIEMQEPVDYCCSYGIE